MVPFCKLIYVNCHRSLEHFW